MKKNNPMGGQTSFDMYRAYSLMDQMQAAAQKDVAPAKETVPASRKPAMMTARKRK